jgi:hypothetical protein
MKALEKITDQELIIEIAKNDGNRLVRKAAIEKIDDPKLATELKLLANNTTLDDLLNHLSSNPDFPKLSDLEDVPYRSRGGTSSSPIQPKRY